MPPARPAKSPARGRPSTSPAPQRPAASAKKNGKAKAGSAADLADADLNEEAEAAAGEASSSSKTPAKAAKTPTKAAAAPAAAAKPAAPVSVPALIGAVVVLILALAGGAYMYTKPGAKAPLPRLGPKAFNGKDLKTSFTGVSMVAFMCAVPLHVPSAAGVLRGARAPPSPGR